MLKSIWGQKIFITGIGTGVGKTVTSGALVRELKADYWKPIQCGDLEQSDSHYISRLTASLKLSTAIFPEAFRLDLPAAPLFAAQKQNLEIRVADLKIPHSSKTLIIEGAGGLMVPINEDESYLDFVKYHQLPVIVVVRPYLGSINHSLLTFKALEQENVSVLGLIFSGDTDPECIEFIQRQSPFRTLGYIKELSRQDLTGDGDEEQLFYPEMRWSSDVHQ